MEILETELKEVKLIKPKIFEDGRGFFYECYNEQVFRELLGIREHFFQDNHSRSCKNVLRGLHYQMVHPQGKLVRAAKGEIFDVAVDMRKSSPNFGKWVGMYLSEKNHLMAWIPPGFAHGFLALSEEADVLYKATSPYHKDSDRSLLWSDSSVGIDWPLTDTPLLSDKDAAGIAMRLADCYT